MDSLLEKLGSYHILTYLIPGAFFVMAMQYFFDISLSRSNIGENILIFYFLGLLISRLGSLMVTPFLRRKWGRKHRSFIVYADYDKYINAVKHDTKIEVLSETNDGFRNLLTCSLLLLLIGLVMVLLPEMQMRITWQMSFIPVLIIIFLFSYREQTRHIKDRVRIVNINNSAQ